MPALMIALALAALYLVTQKTGAKLAPVAVPKSAPAALTPQQAARGGVLGDVASAFSAPRAVVRDFGSQPPQDQANLVASGLVAVGSAAKSLPGLFKDLGLDTTGSPAQQPAGVKNSAPQLTYEQLLYNQSLWERSQQGYSGLGSEQSGADQAAMDLGVETAGGSGYPDYANLWKGEAVGAPNYNQDGPNPDIAAFDYGPAPTFSPDSSHMAPPVPENGYVPEADGSFMQEGPQDTVSSDAGETYGSQEYGAE